MSFNMEEFVAQPSEEMLNTCTKEQLMQIAEHYEIELTSQIKKTKATVYETIKNLLTDREVLAAKREDPVTASVSMIPRSDSELRLKEMEIDKEFALRKLEFENMERQRQFENDERQRQFDLRRLELELAAKGIQIPTSPGEQSPSHTASRDISRYIRMVPPFSERDVDKYFPHFERVATSLKWPKEIWTSLLQCVLVGKAQEIYASVPLEQSVDYEVVKAAILKAYELVPEAYRQRFRQCKKWDQHTYIEFAREKERLFNRWCTSQQVDSLELLRELILLEEFKNCVPEVITTYLNEQKVNTLAEAAVLADEFALTHRNMQPTRSGDGFRNRAPYQGKPRPVVAGPYPASPPRSPSGASGGNFDIVCFYCRNPGHKISDCHAYQNDQCKTVALVAASQCRTNCGCVGSACSHEGGSSEKADYSPFISIGSVSLPGQSSVPVRILRDTGAAQSVLLGGVLPLSARTATGSHALVRGIEMGFRKLPLHHVQLSSGLVTGHVVVGVCASLPVPGVEFILGNDLAGGRVWELTKVAPPAVMVSVPLASDTLGGCAKHFPPVFPISAVPTAKQLQEAEEQERLSCRSEVISKTVEGKRGASPVNSQTRTRGKFNCVNGRSVVGTESGPVELIHTGPGNGHSVSDYRESDTDCSTKQPPANVQGYIGGSRHLYQTRAAAKKALAKSTCKMQRSFGRNAQCFEKGDQVLAVLPFSPFRPNLADPYTMGKCCLDHDCSN